MKMVKENMGKTSFLRDSAPFVFFAMIIIGLLVFEGISLFGGIILLAADGILFLTMAQEKIIVIGLFLILAVLNIGAALLFVGGIVMVLMVQVLFSELFKRGG